MRSIYLDLTGLELPETMPPKETRTLDGVFRLNGTPFVFELDEVQHFNCYRLATLDRYPKTVRLGFDLGEWKTRSRQKTRLEGGGFGKARPPLFPGEGGRHRQRAFRDALADLLPGEYGFLPTLRLTDDEVVTWSHTREAPTVMSRLVRGRLL
ncbi:MAG: hypothetical protein JXA87_10900 [Thermoleophilia bacterium]|nr:hypothetical protein [Thermoleophilia bacterium]